MYRTVTAKGQLVIPSEMRRRVGIKKGTYVFLNDCNGAITITPITDEYLRNKVGKTRTGGKLLKALVETKQTENKRKW